MKPLPPATLTKEDRKIWLCINFPLNKPYLAKRIVSSAYFMADRRDADLMLRLQTFRAQGDCYLRLQMGVRWCNVIVPAAHVYVRRNPLWPSS